MLPLKKTFKGSVTFVKIGGGGGRITPKLILSIQQHKLRGICLPRPCRGAHKFVVGTLTLTLANILEIQPSAGLSYTPPPSVGAWENERQSSLLSFRAVTASAFAMIRNVSHEFFCAEEQDILVSPIACVFNSPRILFCWHISVLFRFSTPSVNWHQVKLIHQITPF